MPKNNESLSNVDKCYFDPGSHILWQHHENVLEDNDNMTKWIDFLSRKKESCIEEWEDSFIECISTYSQVRDISSLDQLSDWDKSLVKKLESKGLIISFEKVQTKPIPAITSVYVKISR